MARGFQFINIYKLIQTCTIIRVVSTVIKRKQRHYNVVCYFILKVNLFFSLFLLLPLISISDQLVLRSIKPQKKQKLKKVLKVL